MDLDDKKPSNSNNKPVCQYGASCYRVNPQHREEYYHPPATSSNISDLAKITVSDTDSTTSSKKRPHGDDGDLIVYRTDYTNPTNYSIVLKTLQNKYWDEKLNLLIQENPTLLTNMSIESLVQKHKQESEDTMFAVIDSKSMDDYTVLLVHFPFYDEEGEEEVPVEERVEYKTARAFGTAVNEIVLNVNTANMDWYEMVGDEVHATEMVKALENPDEYEEFLEGLKGGCGGEDLKGKAKGGKKKAKVDDGAVEVKGYNLTFADNPVAGGSTGPKRLWVVNTKTDMIEFINDSSSSGSGVGALTLQTIPNELISVVFGKLVNKKDISRLGRTCKKLNELSKDPVLWSNLIEYRFGKAKVPEDITNSMNEYKRMHQEGICSTWTLVYRTDFTSNAKFETVLSTLNHYWMKYKLDIHLCDSKSDLNNLSLDALVSHHNSISPHVRTFCVIDSQSMKDYTVQLVHIPYYDDDDDEEEDEEERVPYKTGRAFGTAVNVIMVNLDIANSDWEEMVSFDEVHSTGIQRYYDDTEEYERFLREEVNEVDPVKRAENGERRIYKQE
ncbi:hypothetical protein HDU76_001094 [Blyttiomyces sp. JEL0837]|nr:hypothetical protein HDU76_001094 [Blyttiomyces sp. JEL0837]